jgi:hypothetical protein
MGGMNCEECVRKPCDLRYYPNIRMEELKKGENLKKYMVFR